MATLLQMAVVLAGLACDLDLTNRQNSRFRSPGLSWSYRDLCHRMYASVPRSSYVPYAPTEIVGAEALDFPVAVSQGFDDIWARV